MRSKTANPMRMKRSAHLGLLFLSACALDATAASNAPTVGSARNAGCNDIAGAEALWSARTRWILVGETHGTVDTPQLFADLVCHATKTGRPVVIGLERNESEQSALDTYFASRGSEADRAALLGHPSWQNGRDGRSSEAMVQLIDALRVLKQNGRISGVVAFQPNLRGSQAEREIAMAERLMKASPSENALVIALVGNVHAMKSKQTFGSNSFVPAAGHLPKEGTFAIDVRGSGGSAWNCTPECGAHYNPPHSPVPARGLVASDGVDPRFDAILHLGKETTASPPAVTPTK